MPHEPLVDLFLNAIRIEAISLHERAMAAFVRETLADAPVHLQEDESAARFGGDTGNLVCVPHGFDRTRPAIALFAHLDTPRPTTGVTPIIADGRISSDGSTILGVDNRAGVTALLHLLREIPAISPTENFVVVFTVAEELGMYGAKHLDLRPYNVAMGFVFDCSKRPGTFIQSAVGCSIYKAVIHGRASHAGVAPEKGVSAIKAASSAVATIPQGRLKPKMTANIGMINGGSATNVIPEACTIEGEVRSFDPLEIDGYLADVARTFEVEAERHGAKAEFQSSVDFAPFVLLSSSEAYRRASSVIETLGMTPHPIEYLGGSDANMLNAGGIPSVNLGIGAQNPHGNDEFILIEDLVMTSRIAEALVCGNGTHA